MGKLMIGENQEVISYLDEIADECLIAVDGKDRCDMGLEFEKCLHNAVKSRNIDVDLF